MDNSPLQGKTVLVTRPEKQAVALAEMIGRAGGRVCLFPVIEIHTLPLDDGVCKEIAERISHAGVLIFVSVNAVEHLVQRIPETLASFTGTVLAVGKQSERCLHESGVVQVLSGGDGIGSEALLDLPQLSEESVRGNRIIIVRGRGGREVLRETLLQRGAIVDCVELYERREPQTKPGQFTTIWNESRPDAIIFTSTEGVGNFFNMVDVQGLPGLLDTPVVVYGERLAEFCQASGFRRVMSAGLASDTALLDALLAIYTHDSK